MTATNNGPLAGLRVLDFTERVQGPYGTQILADLGAEVIKVERRKPLTPDGRDDDRYRFEHATLYTATFLSTNRNKKSVTIDLKNEQGKAVVRRLVEVSDVVYENFRPAVMTRLGFGYEQCAEINPSIVYASASGYGSDGPYVAYPGQDVLAQAIGGFGAINISAEGRPTAVGMSITDLMGGMNGAFAVLAALYHRERTGEGQHVEVNLLDTAIAAQSEQAVHFMNAKTFSDPQVLHNNMVVTVDGPAGPLKLVGPAFKLSKTPASIRTAPPRHGEHTDEVLGSIGYSPSEIAELRDQEAI
jgi:crotonobetainyl-CoA:carnitine CoA-transferase CaiB-like acyl-CoA transferase